MADLWSDQYHDVTWVSWRPYSPVTAGVPSQISSNGGLWCIYFFRHDRMTWRHQMETFSALLLALCARNSPVTGDFPSQKPVTRSFDFFICAWTNCWVNNRDASNLRRHRAHYNVTVMNKLLKTGRIPQDLGLWRSCGVTVIRFIRAFWLMSVTHM